MTPISGMYIDGKVILDAPVDWPEGVRVSVSPQTEKIGITEDEWPTTPEGIAEAVERMRSFEAVEFTPEEEAEWLAAREEVKRYTLEKMQQTWKSEQ